MYEAGSNRFGLVWNIHVCSTAVSCSLFNSMTEACQGVFKTCTDLTVGARKASRGDIPCFGAVLGVLELVKLPMAPSVLLLLVLLVMLVVLLL